MKCNLHNIIALCAVLLIAVSSCKSDSNGGSSDGMALVSVGDKTLTLEELDMAIPQGLNPTDSAFAAEAYIKLWVKDQLLFEKAKENLLDDNNVEELVENYRHSLIVFTYQEQLLKEQLAKRISEDDLKKYYDEYSNQFVLDNNIIKGLFLKIPVTSPQLENMKKWYRSESAVEKIEKAHLQNAAVYDYFYDKWVSFEDVVDNIPMGIKDNEQFLKGNKFIEYQDSTFVYLLNIKDYKLVGEPAPYEYARAKALDIVVNQKKKVFLNEIEDDLYNKALRDKNIKFHNNIKQPK